MSRNSAFCPAPFLLEQDFPKIGGDLGARFCTELPILPGITPTCCLPCPAENWFYSDRLPGLLKGAEIVSCLGLAGCLILLISFTVLPIQYTHRHYLSVSLIVAILILTLASVIPIMSKAPQCVDKVTPHNMYSSLNCAFTGALIVGGGWACVAWGLIRTVSVHLQICWKVTPGNKFFFCSQVLGWGSSVLFIAIPLAFSGVSYRFGETCHVKSTNSLQSFWAPLLAIAISSLVLQAITFGYCIKVYIASLMDSSEETNGTDMNSHGAQSKASSVRTVTARQAFRRIKRVLAMQWRGITVVLIMLADVSFLATIFLRFNAISERTPEYKLKVAPWVKCIIAAKGDKNQCLGLASSLVIPEATAMAVLLLVSMNGLWALVLLGRWSIVTGWCQLFKDLFKRKQSSDEFVSAGINDHDRSNFEMLESKGGRDGLSVKEADLESSVGPSPNVTFTRDNLERELRSPTTTGPKPYESNLFQSRIYRNQYPLGNRESTGSMLSEDSSPKLEGLRYPPRITTNNSDRGQSPASTSPVIGQAISSPVEVSVRPGDSRYQSAYDLRQDNRF